MRSKCAAIVCFALSGLVINVMNAMSVTALAQQAPATPKASTPTEAGAPKKTAQPTTPKPATPAPSAMPAIAHKGDGSGPQGFSVVLVLGDLTGTAAADDVPLAARKALTDMRDFLPFKSYKLLDAAWLLCCGQGPGVSALGGGRGQSADLGGGVSQILRGPEEQEYELRLNTSRAENGRVFVKFSLKGGPASSENASSSESSGEQELAQLRAQLAQLEVQLTSLRQKNSPQHPDVVRLEREVNAARRKLENAQGSAEARNNMSRRFAGRSVIDTSFTMDVGETVVVGTSRLRGGSKALIALLTAVPPRPSRRE